MSNWWNWVLDLFLGSLHVREVDETLALAADVKARQGASPLFGEDRLGDFLVGLVFEVCEMRGVAPSMPLARMLYATTKGLLHFDGLLVTFRDPLQIARLTTEESILLRRMLRQQLRFLEDHERLLEIWRSKLLYVFAGMLEYFPLSAFSDVDEQGQLEDDSIVLPQARAMDLCDDLPDVLDRLFATAWDEDIVNARLFDLLRERLHNNALRASGIEPRLQLTQKAKLVAPSDHKNSSPDFLVETYLGGTPLQELFESALPFAIPFPARFEHTHIVGGTGHGKTQLLQFLINHDLVRAMEDGRSVVVIDSQGDLIRTISQLAYFNPEEAASMAERFVLIDPNDVEHPACLNMFDFNRDRLSGYAPVDREKILNATVELYEYFFGALLGAELTQRQGVIFRYLARLLIEIPDATIHTLRKLMEDGEPFRPYMEKLGGTARSFFATRFFDRQFNETKKQILTRLWGVMSNASLERMFSHPKNKVDMFELLNSGKIILINTAKDLLGQEGSAIFGRFFIALIAQAAVQRAAMRPHERRPGFVYIDEAQDYFDDNIGNLLTQARKYRIGQIFAHQNVDQLPPGLRSSVFASTTIKFAGGVSAKDAATLDSEFRCTSDFLLAQKKLSDRTMFACHVRNYTGKALSVKIPLGYVESLPTLTATQYSELLERNRARYTAPPVLEYEEDVAADAPSAPAKPDPVKPPRSSNPAPAAPSDDTESPRSTRTDHRPDAANKQRKPAATSGRGGQQHKYLQHLIKELAEARGFRATVEETILNGAGQVDVGLQREDRRIAFEISVTTSHDHELGNIEKCIAAGYQEVVLVGGNERHLRALTRFIDENLEEKDRDKIRYLLSDALPAYFSELGNVAVVTEQSVRGYKVRSVRQVADAAEAAVRRKAIAAVIARSLTRAGDR